MIRPMPALRSWESGGSMPRGTGATLDIGVEKSDVGIDLRAPAASLKGVARNVRIARWREETE